MHHLLKDKSNGFYVDIGAYSPFDLSNTYFFYRLGWRGILVEPNPSGAASLKSERTRDIVEQCLVSESEGDADYVMTNGGAMNRILGADELSTGLQTTKVKKRTLASILDEHLGLSNSIDILSVDCEGHDLVVLKSNNWTKYSPKIIIAEDSEGDGSPLDSYLHSVGYKLVATMPPSKIFTHI
ncbi:MAG: FkbM family methyltransferase [Verrucomicrobiales bacterium]